MKTLHYSTKAKKDLKKYRHDPQKMKNLYTVLELLVNDMKLPAIYQPHSLAGEYTDCMECHIESDFLLIWLDTKNNIIEILRVGSHSELF